MKDLGLTVTAIIVLIIYTLLLIMLLYNVKVYLIGEKKYSALVSLGLYVFSITVVIARIIQISTILIQSQDSQPWASGDEANMYNVSILFAVYAKLMLGFFESISMQDIKLRMESTKQAENLKINQKQEEMLKLEAKLSCMWAGNATVLVLTTALYMVLVIAVFV